MFFKDYVLHFLRLFPMNIFFKCQSDLDISQIFGPQSPFASKANVPSSVVQMIFSVNIYTPNVTFDQVSNAYCRMCSEDGTELARYVLREARGETGLPDFASALLVLSFW